MNVELSYDKEFGELLNSLRTKYGAEIFEIEGIGSQLDLNKFSKGFFSTKTTADASIDANANVGDSTVVSYSVELTKPYEKLNSLYLLWKEMRRLYHTDIANEIIEMHISGDIYIHDLHSVNKPYSYYKHTTLMVNNELTTMEDLFNNNSLFGDIDNESVEVYVNGLSVTDVSGKTNISRIIRHKPHNKLLKFETKDGHVMVVTEDHPMILSDMSEKLAKDITIDDVLYVDNPEIEFSESFNITDDYAYIIGFWLGDGSYTNKGITFVQNDIANSKIYNILCKHFKVGIVADNKCAIYSMKLFNEFSVYGLRSNQKKLPSNIHKWPKSAINNFVCGLIDAEGTIMPTGCVMIRMNAYGLLHGLRDILINMDGYQHVRMSFYEHDKSPTAYNLNYDMYRLSFRAPFDIIKSSEKMNNHIDKCMRHVNKDGRFESGQVHKIATLKQQEQYVYDITTDSGYFISGGLLVHNCFNYSTYDIVNKGLPMITKIKSVEPKHLYSFKSQLEQFVVIASNSTLGATGIADVLIVMSYYVKNILKSLEDAHFSFKNEDAVWTYVKETITSLVYTLNQPFRGGIQCVTEDTEILTDDGFKKYQQLNIGDMVATFDIKTEDITYQPIQKLNISKYSGQIDCYGNQYVTPNHRVLLSNGDTYKIKYSYNIAYEKVGIPIIIEDTYVINSVFKKSIEYDGIVWCPTTDAGIVIFKRNGETFISGNSAFTNVSIFDQSFLEDLSSMYIFPDGSSPDLNVVKRLQDIYVDVMNETLERTAATFPVTTAACAIDDERWFKNPDDVKHFIRQNLQFGFMNFYSGKSTTLSSCCFDGSQLVDYKINRIKQTSRFDEIPNNGSLRVYYNTTTTVKAKLIKIEMPNDTHLMYRITTATGEVLETTGDHIHITTDGYKYTYELDTNMYFKNLKSNIFTRIDSIESYTSHDKYVYCFEILDNNVHPHFILNNGIITHNCRLRSDMESIGYSNSIGGSSTKIGSVGVGTSNMYRLAVRANGDINKFIELLKHTVGAIARVNHARRTIIKKKSEKGFAPLYEHGFIALDKQFSTYGINGFYEAMCKLGVDITSDDGLKQAIEIIEIVNTENRKYDKAFGYSHNCEQVPGESLSVKIAQKDKILGYNDEYELYSNQFIPLTASADILERIKIQGALDSHFSGGSILHLNFDKRIDDVDKIYDILQDAVRQGVVYMAINYVLNECEDGHISVGNIECCPVCTKQIVNEYTRVVGFLSNVKNWNKTRRVLDFPNRKFYEVK